MPLRAIIRSAVKTLVLLGLFAALLVATITSDGALQIAFSLLTILAAATGALAAYIYIPGFDFAGRFPWRGPRDRNAVAITFDDGPNGHDTGSILDTLARHGAKATFFLLGRSVDAHPDVARRIAAEGHAIGTHTQNHKKLHFASRAEIESEVKAGVETLKRHGIRNDRLFRAPHGLKSPFLPRVLRNNGLRAIAWTDGVWDTDQPGVDVIVARSVSRLRPGEILLLHDGGSGTDRSQTAAALEPILVYCRNRGLACVTIPELFDGGAK
jgi:peptidoglycan/xylan/chitin deacetylase (PgdA/CDA1 family)